MNTKKIKRFFEDNKKEIVCGAIGTAMFIFGVRIIYKTGFKAGVYANTLVDKAPIVAKGIVDGDNYILSLVGPTYGCGDLEHGIIWTNEEAIKAAKDILKDLGCLKEIVEIPEDIAKEVIANG